MPSFSNHMQLVLSGADQRELDRLAMEDFGMPPFALMENAGREAAAAINQHFGPMDSRRIVIACGKGNNGGDGLVVARALFGRCAHVNVLMLGPPGSPEARLNLSLLQKLQESDADGRLTVSTWDASLESIPEADLFVDAILGTGLTRAVRGSAASLIAQINAARGPVVALDVPSGLSADTGVPLGSAVKANLTVTMASLKPGLLLNDGSRYAGQVHVADIGIPNHLAFAESIGQRHWHTTDHGVAALLPDRPPLAHKYSAGMVLVLGGSKGLTGAPVMAATAAARVGAGYVACAVPASVHRIVAGKLMEIATVALPENADGGLDSHACMEVLQPWLSKTGALLVGPGMGRHPNTQTFANRLLATTELPAVIDADGLHALETDQIAANSGDRWILTPHWGEFRSMVAEAIQPLHVLQLAREWSRNWNSTVVLKGLPSIVASPNEDGVICSTGSNALATAGSGDVLAGLCAGLAAQGCSATDAATCAIHLAGAAADAYSARLPGETMMAMDMLTELPHVLGRLRGTRKDES